MMCTFLGCTVEELPERMAEAAGAAGDPLSRHLADE